MTRIIRSICRRFLLPCVVSGAAITAASCGSDSVEPTPADQQPALNGVRTTFDHAAEAVNTNNQQAFTELLCAETRNSADYKSAPWFTGFPAGPVLNVEAPKIDRPNWASLYATINYDNSPMRAYFSFTWENDQWKFCPQALLVAG